MKILNWKTKEIIFEDSFSIMKETVENAVKQKISLEYADLFRANLSNSDLSNANLMNADLRCANLNNADLNNTNLINADLYNVNSSNLNLENTDLTNTSLYGSNLRDAKLREIDIEKLYFNYHKNWHSFNFVKEEVLNHPNCSEKLKLKIKMYNLLS